MSVVKEIAVIAGLIVVIINQIRYMDHKYQTKDGAAKVESSIMAEVKSNTDEISRLAKKGKRTDSILCGIAIDMNLPTAKEECKKVIAE